MTSAQVLSAIPSTEPATFNEFLRALGGDFDGDWRELFQTVEFLENAGLVEVERLNGRIDTLILTEAGVAQVREGVRK